MLNIIQGMKDKLNRTQVNEAETVDGQVTETKNTESVDMVRVHLRRQAGLAVVSVVAVLVLVAAMTVAWYSNVIHNESLTFQADSWDFQFEGKVLMDNSLYTASPGRSGVVEFSLENKGDEAIDVVVNINNQQLLDEMKKRLYFYVDDAKTVTGQDAAGAPRVEVTDRTYINDSDGYAYMVFGKNTLTIGEEDANGALLKWEWVYDVLGYYVQGTINDTTEKIDRYLRPVTYDYEKATYELVDLAQEATATGKLLTVDGTTTVEQYLAQLSQNDGYLQDINYSGEKKGYYPISVDENGYGIWVYLCNKSEIEGANVFDSMLGKQAAGKTTEGQENPLDFSVTLLLSGQQRKENVAQAATAEEIKAALADTTIDKITLSGDVQLTEAVTVPEGRALTMDLNGNTLTTTATGRMMTAGKGATVTIVDGTIKMPEGSAPSEPVITTYGAQLTMNKVVMNNVYRALMIEDNAAAAAGTDSRVIVEGCTMDCTGPVIMIKGNGGASSAKTKLVIHDSLLTSGYITIAGNGAQDPVNAAWGTDITITGSTLKGNWSAIYHPEKDSTMTIANSTLEGKTGIAVKAGKVDIDTVTINATGDKAAPSLQGDGFSDTGDGIYVETNYKHPVEISVKGQSHVVSKNGYAIQVYEPDATWVSVVLTGGTYSSDVTAFLPAEGSHVCTKQADNQYAVAEAPAKAPQ